MGSSESKITGLSFTFGKKSPEDFQPKYGYINVYEYDYFSDIGMSMKGFPKRTLLRQEFQEAPVHNELFQLGPYRWGNVLCPDESIIPIGATHVQFYGVLDGKPVLQEVELPHEHIAAGMKTVYTQKINDTDSIVWQGPYLHEVKLKWSW